MLKFKRFDRLDADTKHVLTTMQLHCLPDDEPYFPDTGWWWIGTDDKQAVAFCLLTPSSQWSDTVYLARSGVLPAWRGRGLQKRMISLREKFARKRNYKWIISDTTANPPSANSLITRGYKVYTPKNPWGYDTTLYWRKKLKDT